MKPCDWSANSENGSIDDINTTNASNSENSSNDDIDLTKATDSENGSSSVNNDTDIDLNHNVDLPFVIILISIFFTLTQYI